MEWIAEMRWNWNSSLPAIIARLEFLQNFNGTKLNIHVHTIFQGIASTTVLITEILGVNAFRASPVFPLMLKSYSRDLTKVKGKSVQLKWQKIVIPSHNRGRWES